MKNSKVLIIIVLSFALGLGASRIFLKKELPAYEKAEESEEEKGIHHEGEEVHVNKDAQAMLGVEMMEVKKAPLTMKISVTGQIAQDVENVSNVLAPKAGMMIECRTQVGSIVKKDERLCVIKGEINAEDVEVRSPRAGVVIADFHKVGDKVDTVSAIHAVADLSKLWANFDVYEKDIAQVRIGQTVLVRSMAYGDEVFEGKIVFISPRVDDTSRTIKIRASIENPKIFLKMGMFLNGEIISKSDEVYLTLPATAIQTLGKKKVVFIKTDEGKFQSREVGIKAETPNEVALSGGITEGEWIVSKGAFLLKSSLLADQLEEE